MALYRRIRWVPNNVSDVARDVLRFVDALQMREIDLLGFSLVGYSGQELVLVRPPLIRRLVRAGTPSQRRPRIHRWTDDVYALATQDVPTRPLLEELLLPISISARMRHADRRPFRRAGRRVSPAQRGDAAGSQR
jgi:pimeloyl-ACP methyl ester carboxylesterase